MASACLTSSATNVGVPLYVRTLANMGFIMERLLLFGSRTDIARPSNDSRPEWAGRFPALGHHGPSMVQRKIESLDALHRITRCMLGPSWNDSTTITCSTSGW